MGVGRWILIRDVKSDLKTIQNLEPDDREWLYETMQGAMAEICLNLGIDADLIIESESFHVVEDAHWAHAPSIINTQYRLPLGVSAKAGGETAMIMYLAAGVILHSIRAILDFELHNRKDLMLYCQTIWYDLSNGDFEKIPPRFTGN